MSRHEFSQLPLSEQVSLMSRLNAAILNVLGETLAEREAPTAALREQLDAAITSRSQGMINRSTASLYSQN